MRHAAPALSLLALIFLAAAPVHGQGAATFAASLAQVPAQQFFLPQGLSEVSGLAVASADTVYAHDDEYGIVYEIDLRQEKVIKAFALGKPTVKDDFEDIAVRGDYVYLLTSDGRIFEAPKGEHRKRVHYNVYDTGVGDRCETEGLANGPTDDEFLILCKKPHQATLKEHLVIYAWNLRDHLPTVTTWLDVPLDGLVEELDQATFHPSAFVWRREKGTLLIVSAKNHIAIETDQQGRLISRTRLRKDLHPQPEGLALMPDGRLIVGDEGQRGRGKISVYAPPR